MGKQTREQIRKT